MPRIVLYDTTLRDGAQTEGVSLSVEDRLKIARKLDELGIPYIEGGFPSPGNRTDLALFEKLRAEPLEHARLVAFAITRRASLKAKDDPGLRTVVGLGAPAVALVAKTWDLHVREAVRVSLDANLEMIADSVRFLKNHGLEVFFDAEHFFDGYRDNPQYALRCLKTAEEVGADWLCLCDTNGGTLPAELGRAIQAASRETKQPLGIHAHNDCEVAVANSLLAVDLGVRLVQGTINGYGERCGNANLCSVIANLQLKQGRRCLRDSALARLYEISHYVAEVANMTPYERQPFVGRSAFAHKGGLHVDAVLKRPETYEHVPPETVGNQRRLLVSDQAGSSAMVYKARGLELELDKGSPEAKELLKRLKDLEHEGYQFEGAEASFELLMRKSMGLYQKGFDLEGFRVIVEKRGDEDIKTEATIKLRVDGEAEHTAAEGDGPVHALDSALRKALERFYPALREIKLTDFKVRVVNPAAGTGAKVRVLIESSDEEDSWSTVGVHENVIEASWQALVDGVEYGLARRQSRRRPESGAGSRKRKAKRRPSP